MSSPSLKQAIVIVAFLGACAVFAHTLWRRDRATRSRGPTPAARWIHKADSGDSRTECVGIRKLGELRPPEGLPVVIGKLKSRVVAVRIAAASTLGRYRDPQAVEPLIVALGDKHPVAKVAAIEALGDIGDARALRPLAALLVPKGYGLQAGEAIGRLRAPESEDILIGVLTSSDPWIRRGAIAGLRLCGTEKCISALKRLLDDPLAELDPVLVEALYPERGQVAWQAADLAARRTIAGPLKYTIEVIERRLRDTGGRNNETK